MLNRCKNYREHNINGNPYYENTSDSQGLGLSIYHPLAYYTNTLKTDKPKDEQDTTVYFPFYSLDFLYRFYEEFRQLCRKTKNYDSENLKSTFSSFHSYKITAIDNLLNTVSFYIPLKNQKSHYDQCGVPAYLLTLRDDETK